MVGKELKLEISVKANTWLSYKLASAAIAAAHEFLSAYFQKVGGMTANYYVDGLEVAEPKPNENAFHHKV